MAYLDSVKLLLFYSTLLPGVAPAGFDTSAAYCAGMPWAAGDARTWPVIRGAVQVNG